MPRYDPILGPMFSTADLRAFREMEKLQTMSGLTQAMETAQKFAKTYETFAVPFGEAQKLAALAATDYFGASRHSVEAQLRDLAISKVSWLDTLKTTDLFQSVLSHSAVMERAISIPRVSQSAIAALEGLKHETQLANETLRIHSSWLELAKVSGIDPLLQRSWSLIDIAAKTLPHVEAAEFGLAAGFEPHHARALFDSVGRFTSSVGDLLGRFQRRQDAVLELPSLVVAEPPRELFLHVTAVDVITATERPQPRPPEAQSELVRIDEETREQLPRLLEKHLSADYTRKLSGAREALLSRNPDRAAHAAASMRELFKQALLGLTPDDKIRPFCKSKSDFHQGRPSREARVRYLTRKADPDTFAPSVKRDLLAVSVLFDVLNSEIHSVVQTVSPEDMATLVLRMERCLLVILRAVDLPEH